MSGVPEVKSVEEAVLAFFEGGSQIEKARSSSGKLSSWFEWTAQVDAPESFEDIHLQMEHVAVERLDGDRAEVDLRATISGIFVCGRGRQRFRQTITGPVRLRRLAGDWKIADYRADGRSVAGSILVHGTHSEGHGIRLQALGSLQGGRSVNTIVRAWNERPHAVWARVVMHAGRSALRAPGALAADVTLPPQQTTVFRTMVKAPRRGGPARLKLVLPIFDMGARRWFTVPLDMRAEVAP